MGLNDEMIQTVVIHCSRMNQMVTKSPRRFNGAFDVYTAVQPIGAGGAGTVFEVTDSEGKRLALKLLTQASTVKLKRFRNEINFCFKPVSKHIIEVLDFAKTDDGSLFYVMPLYSCALKERIKSGIKPSEVLRLFGRILDGVEAAHLLGVIHRDIKPANLLYAAGTDEVVVADFGIAHFREEDLLTLVETDSAERLANFQYSAPEQKVPGGFIDQRADIFALGLILNEMFTGHVPQGSGYKQIQAVTSEFGYLDALVDQMIRQQPDDRPQSIRKIKEELISRGNQAIEFQRLESLKKQIVPESEVSDPIIADPIRAVEKLDYSNSTLSLRLNQPINPVWENCFRMRALSYTGNFSAAMVTFRRDKAFLIVNDHFLPQAVTSFKQWCEATNETYASQVKQEHQLSIVSMRLELQNKISEQERKSKILNSIKL